MGKFVDLTGRRFCRLTVLEEAEPYISPKGVKSKRYKCLCDCGNRAVVVAAKLTSGNTKSCGCYQRQRAKERLTIHGKSKERLYYVWRDMNRVCFDPNNKDYKYYGARGITVCEEWRGDNGRINFYNWAYDNGYKEEILPNGINKWTVERIDNDGNFEPNNCCFATMLAQGNNKRNNHLVAHCGETLTLSQAARKGNTLSGINVSTFKSRVKNGMTATQATETPTLEPKHYEYKGKYYSVAEILKLFGIGKATFRYRINKGMSVAEAIETPIRRRNKK